MGSSAPAEAGTEPGRQLLQARAWITVWIPILLIGALHYASGSELAWAHDIYRRLYYLPIVLAAFGFGLRGSLSAALLVAVSYAPHAFLHQHVMHVDPARSIEKVLELLLYFLVAAVAGHLADQGHIRRLQLRRALDEQRRLTAQLVRAGRLGALGEVVAGIAHEIKNPLHALAGSAEIVDAVVPRDAEERRIWELHRAVIKRLEQIAERFLSFAHPSPPQRARLDLREVAERLRDLVGSDARQKNVEIELALAPDPVMVMGDRDQLSQVGLNIAINAFNAMGAGGGRLRVAVEQVEHDGRARASLRFENDGPPLPEQGLEQLFDPFHSGDDGSGLGLSISARIAEQHDGFLEARNGGLGVTFSLLLPLA